MKEMKLLTSDALSHYLIEPICAKLSIQDPSFRFSILSATVDREPEVDVYFLLYKHLFENFIHEVLAESKMSLWASSEYLERNGVPKKLDDLLSHTIVRPERGAVTVEFGVKRFGTTRYYDPYYHKKESVRVDDIMSVVNLAEAGAGIAGLTHLSVDKFKCRLEKIPTIEGDEGNCYRQFVVGYHERHKDDPNVRLLVHNLRSLLAKK
jgi:DNA-binding transcriptional LysR family regulator